jgi:transposase
VDEHSFRGHDMVLIITELKTKKLIAVLPSITKDCLENWINSIPIKIQIKIK